MADSLSITIDVAEPRLAADLTSLLVDGRDWESILSTAVKDAVTLTGFLPPLPYTPEWRTTTTGDYKRLTKADYKLTTAAKWVEQPKDIAGNIYLQAQGVNEVVTTLAEYERNQGFFLSWFSYNSGNEDFVQLECGWGSFTPGGGPTGGVGSDLWFRVHSSGEVEIYQQDQKVGEGHIDKFTAGTWAQFGEEPQKNRTRGVGGTTVQANQTIDMMLFPCRGRDILLLSNRGGGFTYTNEAIDAEEEDAEITPPGTFWWYVPTGQATVQCAPLKFKTSGALVSRLQTFRRPPATDAEPDLVVLYDMPGYGVPPAYEATLVLNDGVTPFVPNGVQNQARVRVDLSGDGTNTINIYSVAAAFGGTIVYTDDSEATVLDDFTREPMPSLSVPESPSDVRFTVALKSPDTIAIAGGVAIAEQSNRPIVATIGSREVFRGAIEAPSFEESVSDEAREVVLECRDWFKRLENYRFQESIPLDGLFLHEAFRQLLLLAGFPDAQLAIEPIDFKLPTVGSSSQGDYALLPKEGQDTAAKWVKDLWEKFCSIYTYGFKPTADGVKFFVQSPGSIGTTPVATVYLQESDSVNFGGLSPGSYWTWARTFKKRRLEPEANDIWCVGRDPRTLRPIVSHQVDVTSQLPNLPPSLRPSNWLGEIRRFGWVDQALTTQAACDWASSVFALRLFPQRIFAEWESDFLLKSDGVPVWRGDNVLIYGEGVFKVTALSGSFDLEDGVNGWIWRPFKYVAEQVA